jgi:predicted nucleic acid-binding Zn ribbon protein
MGEFSLSDAIQQFLNQSRIKGDIQAMQIEEIWEKIMGKTIARYTDKLQIFGNKLVITTQVGPLKQELLYQKEKIIQRVNEAFGKKIIEEILIQ